MGEKIWEGNIGAIYKRSRNPYDENLPYTQDYGKKGLVFCGYQLLGTSPFDLTVCLHRYKKEDRERKSLYGFQVVDYATALDYDKNAKTTKEFFAKIQNKLHYAVHKHTAAELVVERADSTKSNMGLTSWKNAPDGKIIKSDVTVAKNYLTEEEMTSLQLIVSAYLDLAENRARRRIPMTMEDWAKRIDIYLKADDLEVLKDAGKITARIAKEHAETEFEKYRIIQDNIFMSDYDKYLLELEAEIKGED